MTLHPALGAAQIERDETPAIFQRVSSESFISFFRCSIEMKFEVKDDEAQ